MSLLIIKTSDGYQNCQKKLLLNQNLPQQQVPWRVHLWKVLCWTSVPSRWVHSQCYIEATHQVHEKEIRSNRKGVSWSWKIPQKGAQEQVK